MFGRDLILSLVLHLSILAVTSVATMFSPFEKTDFGEVIRITAVSLPAPEQQQPEPEPIIDMDIPQPVVEEDLDIPLSDPTSQPAVKTEKPKKEKIEQPKATPKKKQPSTSPTKQTDNAKSTDIETGSNSPFSGATVDNITFDYPIWFRQVFNKIAGNMRHSVVTDATLITVIYFQVLQSGRIVNLKVEQPSGYVAFDDACMAAVSRSAPFPRLPRDFRDEIIGITLPVKYSP